MQFRGVIDVEVGYAGGQLANPTYEQVCSETTGHAEVAKVSFDQEQIPAEVILDIFFTLHDPTQLNRQGNDVGTSYRSCMFFDSEEQRVLFDAALVRARESWGEGVVTTLEPLEKFWPGEEYHQDFFAKNPNQGYCNFVVRPKMEKSAKAFSQYLK